MTLSKMPALLAAINAVVSIACATYAIVFPHSSRFMFLIVFEMDFPASILVAEVVRFLPAGLNPRTLAFLFGLLFTVAGAIWFYFLGWISLKSWDMVLALVKKLRA